MSLASPQLSESERKRLGRKIAAACRSAEITVLLAPWSCGPLDRGSLMIAEALRQALDAGDVCGLHGFALSPLGAPTIFRQAVLRLCPDVYADASGVLASKGLHKRWLRAGVIITAITPLPPADTWPTTLPEFPADTATIGQMAALLQHIVA